MQSIEIKFPDSVSLNPSLVEKMSALNPGLDLSYESSLLRIREGGLSFWEQDFFKLHLPFNMQEEELFELGDLNAGLRLEGEEDLLIINMGTLGLIGAFTVLIGATLVIWNRKMKMGRVFDSSTNHDLEVEGKKMYRLPDVSFILYEKFSKQVLDEKYRLGAPTLCIEVVSHKNSLKQDLEKMKEDWMRAGTEIGLVVCPHRKKYYLFEKGKAAYQTLAFSKPFRHDLLFELTLDFSLLLKEAMEEVKREGELR